MRYTFLIVTLAVLYCTGCGSNRYVLHAPLKIRVGGGDEIVLPAGTRLETHIIKGNQVEVQIFGQGLHSEVERAGVRQ